MALTLSASTCVRHWRQSTFSVRALAQITIPLTLSLRLQSEIRQHNHTSGATRRGVGKNQQLYLDHYKTGTQLRFTQDDCNGA